MKKTYLMPATSIVKVKLQKMIAGSPLNISGDSGTAKFNDTELGTQDVVLSRGNSVWDDEDEE